MDFESSSSTVRCSTSSFIATPTSSRDRIITASPHSSQHNPPLPPIPEGGWRWPATTRSVVSWKTAYPRVGQFIMTGSEEVIAAGPDGLFQLRRVKDQDSKPWSEMRPLPEISNMLNDTSVSGMAAISVCRPDRRVYVYSVSGGKIHSFYLSEGSLRIEDPPPLAGYFVSGTPAVLTLKDKDARMWIGELEQWSLVVPCQSGGLFFTSTHNSYRGSRQPKYRSSTLVAQNLGIVSSVAISATLPWTGRGIMAACIASGRLHTVEGVLKQQSTATTWAAQESIRIYHRGKVTGNPVLFMTADRGEMGQFDLLVPSAGGGIFHFVQPASSRKEWHMIAHIAFLEGLPTVSCLVVFNDPKNSPRWRHHRALLQSGGQLYHIKTLKIAHPWSGSYPKPLVAPGPFDD